MPKSIRVPLDKATISKLIVDVEGNRGRIGGRRMETMTAEERSNAARVAARARWREVKPNEASVRRALGVLSRLTPQQRRRLATEAAAARRARARG